MVWACVPWLAGEGAVPHACRTAALFSTVECRSVGQANRIGICRRRRGDDRPPRSAAPQKARPTCNGDDASPSAGRHSPARGRRHRYSPGDRPTPSARGRQADRESRPIRATEPRPQPHLRPRRAARTGYSGIPVKKRHLITKWPLRKSGDPRRDARALRSAQRGSPHGNAGDRAPAFPWRSASR